LKLITAVLAPEKLDAVAAALAEVEVFRMTVTECRGVRPGEGESSGGLVDKAKLEIAVNENFVQPTLRALQSAGQLEEDSGFGKIFVTELLDVVRIRTGERGPDAI
jgi:nitrogen regulatory protein PII